MGDLGKVEYADEGDAAPDIGFQDMPPIVDEFLAPEGNVARHSCSIEEDIDGSSSQVVLDFPRILAAV